LPDGNREKETKRQRLFEKEETTSFYPCIQNEAGKGIAGLRESGKNEQPDIECARGERE
jgi:hypothetical protein